VRRPPKRCTSATELLQHERLVPAPPNRGRPFRIANDFDVAGVPEAREPGFDKRPSHVVIPELNEVRRAFKIHAALDKAGFKTGEVEKIMGGNWMRVLSSTLG
jgi:hypothetical protein